MGKLVAIIASLGMAACQSTPEECWYHDTTLSNFYRDDAFCTSQGDAVGGYLTGGLAGAVAEKRKYNACMASKGYYLASCTQ